MPPSPWAQLCLGHGEGVLDGVEDQPPLHPCSLMWQLLQSWVRLRPRVSLAYWDALLEPRTNPRRQISASEPGFECKAVSPSASHCSPFQKQLMPFISWWAPGGTQSLTRGTWGPCDESRMLSDLATRSGVPSSICCQGERARREADWAQARTETQESYWAGSWLPGGLSPASCRPSLHPHLRHRSLRPSCPRIENSSPHHVQSLGDTWHNTGEGRTHGQGTHRHRVPDEAGGTWGTGTLVLPFIGECENDLGVMGWWVTAKRSDLKHQLSGEVLAWRPVPHLALIPRQAGSGTAPPSGTGSHWSQLASCQATQDETSRSFCRQSWALSTAC